MDQQALAPHESMQLHELLNFKNISLTKSVTMSPLVSDNELKNILQNDASICKQHIKELRGLLEHSNIAVGTAANTPGDTTERIVIS